MTCLPCVREPVPCRRVLVQTLLLAGLASAQDSSTAIVSVGGSGAQGDGDAWAAAVSPDGRFVVFETDATDLVVPDVGSKRDIVIKDMQTGLVERLSVNSIEVQANDDSYEPVLSADGRFVAFTSPATNLAPHDDNDFDDVFLRDRIAGTTVRLSVNAAGIEGQGNSARPWITPDGRYVAFQSQADLVPVLLPGALNIFVRDLQTGTITVEIDDADLPSGAGGNRDPILTPDARYLAFTSDSHELVPGDANFSTDVFVRDRLLGTFERVSVDSLGLEHPGDCFDPWISDDGRFVSFTTAAFLDAADVNLERDVYVRDRALDLTLLVSAHLADVPSPPQPSMEAVLSANGRWVVFQSNAPNLVPGDTNGFRDLFRHDLLHGVTSLVTGGFAGDPTSEGSSFPSLTPDGRLVAFESKAANLVPADLNGEQDIFLLDVGPWADAGSALAGVSGPPLLEGHGTLEIDAACSLTLSAAAPSAPAMLCVSLGSTPVSFKGGTLVAFPFIVQVLLATDPAGGLFLPLLWPAGVPSGTHLDFQCAIQDATAPAGASLSNAVDALTP